MSESKKLTGILTGAMSMFGPTKNTSVLAASDMTQSNHGDDVGDFAEIPKEDLMQLCMKLNKRMQMMEKAGKELSNKNKMLRVERSKMIMFLSEILSTPLKFADDEVVDVSSLRESWKRKDDEKLHKMQSLQHQLQLLQHNLKLGSEQDHIITSEGVMDSFKDSSTDQPVESTAGSAEHDLEVNYIS